MNQALPTTPSSFKTTKNNADDNPNIYQHSKDTQKRWISSVFSRKSSKALHSQRVLSNRCSSRFFTCVEYALGCIDEVKEIVAATMIYYSCDSTNS